MPDHLQTIDIREVEIEEDAVRLEGSQTGKSALPARVPPTTGDGAQFKLSEIVHVLRTEVLVLDYEIIINLKISLKNSAAHIALYIFI